MTLPSALPEPVARDVAAVGRIAAVPMLLRTVCELTGMRFAAVARVTDDSWTACAVHDDIAFGLVAGGQLDVHTTLCKESRQAGAPVVIDAASKDPVYAAHHTPRIYGIESYVSVPILLEGGEYFGNLCAIDPLPAQVSTPRVVATFQLFAELIASQLAHERMLDSARAAGELREQFMAILSHDLRNPLNAASMSAHLLKAKSGSDDLRGHADVILRSVRRMAGLIDDMLDLTKSRLGSGLDLRPIVLSAPEIAQTLRDVVAELAAAHPHGVVATGIAIDRSVRCDPARLQQLLSNLLANALTHGARGQPIHVDATIDGETLVLRVANRGAPIPAPVLQHLFEPFQRGVAAGTGQPAGLGLGLYICAQIAHAHGGTLTAASSAADGTVFEARLPA